MEYLPENLPMVHGEGHRAIEAVAFYTNSIKYICILRLFMIPFLQNFNLYLCKYSNTYFYFYKQKDVGNFANTVLPQTSNIYILLDFLQIHKSVSVLARAVLFLISYFPTFLSIFI